VCFASSRAARARADKDEDSAIYEKEGGVMRCLGAGMQVRMAALGWQRRSGCVGGRPRGGWGGPARGGQM